MAMRSLRQVTITEVRTADGRLYGVAVLFGQEARPKLTAALSRLLSGLMRYWRPKG